MKRKVFRTKDGQAYIDARDLDETPESFEDYTCEICGKYTGQNAIIDPFSNGDFRILCRGCASCLGECPTCANHSSCGIKTDTSGIPKFVQQTVQNGNFVSVKTVINPQLTDMYCRKNCPCFDTNLGCCRQKMTCENYKDIAEKEK